MNQALMEENRPCLSRPPGCVGQNEENDKLLAII